MVAAGAVAAARLLATYTAASFLTAYDPQFFTLVDPAAQLQIIAESPVDFAHEAPVWLSATNELFFTSNRLDPQNQSISGNSSVPSHVQLYRLALDKATNATLIQPNPQILMANGAIGVAPDQVVVCSQGLGSVGGSLVQLNVTSLAATTLLNSFNGLEFNSPNDIIYSPVHQGFLFTDPPYGADQGFRDAPPQLPPSVYYYNNNTGQVIALITNMVKPNGLVLSLDSRTLYITETGQFVTGPGQINPAVPRVIYRFDVGMAADGSPTVANQTVFASIDVGVADGIKLDAKGNVWTGVGDGVSVYAPDGRRLGRVATGGGVSNLAFTPDGLVMLAEQKIFRLKLTVAGANL